jgi:hypothetical protein
MQLELLEKIRAATSAHHGVAAASLHCNRA